jgi:predicted dehydrogenase
MKDSEVNAVDICIPHYAQHKVAIPFIKRKINVLIEKPLGITIKAAKKIVEEAEKEKVTVAVAENLRRTMNCRAWVWAIRNKKIIGDIYLANIQLINCYPQYEDSLATKWRNIKILSGGGLFMDEGHHFVDMLHLLFGEVEEVYAEMKTINDVQIKDVPVLGDAKADIEDMLNCILRFKSGVNVICNYLRCSYGKNSNFANYYGSKGIIEDLSFPFNPFHSKGGNALLKGCKIVNEEIKEEYISSLTTNEKHKLFPFGSNNMYAIEIFDFIESLLNGKKPEFDAMDSLKAIAVCESIYESATIKKSVRFKDVLDEKICEYQKSINEYWKI